jgi:Flp pilus assembly protein TadG
MRNERRIDMTHIQKFRKDVKGSTAMVFALALVPIFGFGAAALDYSRSSDVKTKLQKAVDATALLVGKDAPKLSESQLKARAEAVFRAEFTVANPHNANIPAITVSRDSRLIRVSATATVPMAMMKLLGRNTSVVNANSEVIWGVPNTEVALAIDTTGSMRDDMDALKLASKDFTDTILSASDGNNIKMSLVPYVASVNVGRNFSPGQLDTRGDSRWHAQAMKNRWIGFLTGCNPYPYGGGSGGGGPLPSEQGPSGNDRTTGLWPKVKSFASLATQLFGISTAQAAGPNVTPDTNAATYSGTNYSPGAPYVSAGESGFVPNGFSAQSKCWLANPAKISHLDLFDRIGVRWKGCVEARPEPYDVSDTSPSASNPDTLFVPYFWPDEPGKKGENTGYVNNYLNDLPTARGWQVDWDDQKSANLLKYTPTNVPTVVQTGSVTKGPNAGCPQELVRLTSDKNAILNQIDTLTHLESGGTIASEGVMWGWRTLAPNAPFADGREYADSKKFLVLMSDGINSLQENNRYGPTKTDYNAYGYLKSGRFPSELFVDAENYLNQRMQLACRNAKATGIKVYTILYRETSPVGRNAMRDCASEPSKAFYAANQSELRNVFSSIAGEIIRLRITR